MQHFLLIKSLILLASFNYCCDSWAMVPDMDRHPTREVTGSPTGRGATRAVSSVTPDLGAEAAVPRWSCCTKILDALCCVQTKTDQIMLFGSDGFDSLRRPVQNRAYEQYLISPEKLAPDERERLAQQREQVVQLVRRRAVGAARTSAVWGAAVIGLTGAVRHYQRMQNLKLD